MELSFPIKNANSPSLSVHLRPYRAIRLLELPIEMTSDVRLQRVHMFVMSWLLSGSVRDS